MITKSHLEKLLAYRGSPESPILSVYLDVDQSREANRLRQFETTLKNLLRSAEQRLESDPERKHFGDDADRIVRFVSDYQPHARSLAAFCDDSEGFFWQQETYAPLANAARWNGAPFVRPLMEALDEYERYGVILADRTRARLFTVFMKEIEEHEGAFAPASSRHPRSSGMDHMRSQMQFQRKADLHVQWHLKHVAEMMDDLADAHSFDRLLLAGPVEATSELYRLLPKRLRFRVVTSAGIPVESAEREILEATLRIEADVERAHEIRSVEDLITAAAKQGPAVTGLARTLEMLQQGRIWRLVYSEGFRPRGMRCAHCETLFLEGLWTCPYCSGAVQPIEDLLESVIERTAEAGGKVETVQGVAADRLRAAGCIGAFLRF